MKKLFFLLFIILVSFKGDYQNYTYNFDCFIEYKTKDNVLSYMLNSKDSTYNLQLYKVDKVLVGFIINKKNNKRFSYQVNNSTSGFDFRYLNSQDMNFEKSKNYKSNFVFDRKLQIIDSVFSNLKITVFKNNQRKNIVRQIEILLKKEDFILTNDFINHFTHGTFINNNINFPKNYIPRKIVIEYKDLSKKTFTYNLNQFKKINTQLITK